MLFCTYRWIHIDVAGFFENTLDQTPLPQNHHGSGGNLLLSCSTEFYMPLFCAATVLLLLLLLIRDG